VASVGDKSTGSTGLVLSSDAKEEEVIEGHYSYYRTAAPCAYLGLVLFIVLITDQSNHIHNNVIFLR
jgi:hypothetical protein